MRRSKWLVATVMTLLALGILGGVVRGSATPPAGVPFPFQGYLTSGGVPVNELCDLRISLYDLDLGGTALATQEVTGVRVDKGMFTVMLQFSPQYLTGEPRWLETAVSCAGSGGAYTTLSPRQPLTSVPYAAQAASAAALKGNPVGGAQPQVGQTLQWNGAEWVPVDVPAGGGVTSVTAMAPLASSGGSDPVITLPLATATVNGAMSAADKAKLDSLRSFNAGSGLAISGSTISLMGCTTFGQTLTWMGSGWTCGTASGDGTGTGGTTGGITGLTVKAPLYSTGGATPEISLPLATTTSDGAMSAADKAKLSFLQPVNAGAGLSMAGGTMSLSNCTSPNQFLKWTGATWSCVSAGGTLISTTEAPSTTNAHYFTSNGGSVSITLSGTVMGSAEGQVGLFVKVDGTVVGSARLYIAADELNRHRALPAFTVAKPMAAGNHTLTIELMPNTSWDQNDVYSLTVIEHP